MIGLIVFSVAVGAFALGVLTAALCVVAKRDDDTT